MSNLQEVTTDAEVGRGGTVVAVAARDGRHDDDLVYVIAVVVGVVEGNPPVLGLGEPFRGGLPPSLPLPRNDARGGAGLPQAGRSGGGPSRGGSPPTPPRGGGGLVELKK